MSWYHMNREFEVLGYSENVKESSDRLVSGDHLFSAKTWGVRTEKSGLVGK